MSAGVSSGGGSGKRGHGEQDFELNLASIIDCFTVLIAFMLVSASFLSIGILDAGVAASGEGAKDGTPPPINISVELKQDHRFSLKVTGKANQNNEIAAQDGKWDLNGLTTQLTALKQKWPEVSAMTLTAENNVEYKDVIQVMDAARKTLPAVLLGGF